MPATDDKPDIQRVEPAPLSLPDLEQEIDEAALKVVPPPQLERAEGVTSMDEAAAFLEDVLDSDAWKVLVWLQRVVASTLPMGEAMNDREAENTRRFLKTILYLYHKVT